MKEAWYTKRWFVAVAHAAAWILLFSLPYLLRPNYNDQPRKNVPSENARFYFSMGMNLSWILLFYFNGLFLIPRLVYRKKYLLYAFALAAIFCYLIAQTWILENVLNLTPYNIRRHLLWTFFIFLFILAASTAYQMIRDRMNTERMAKDRENENLKTELAFLRSQVSPHFMFNVLNNMVALARKKSDLLEPSLIKLSSLLRYMLYETDEEKVLLEKEIEYLQSYIDLQIQRFGSKVKVNVCMKDYDRSYFIEPMLLIPFVENAFKHGTGMIQNAEITIELKARNNILQFLVSNNFDSSVREEKDKTSGIGLQNVKRRLNLLYKNRHTLSIDNNDNNYVVSLQLNMSNA
jgi:sensor histidine kinase YesM